MRGGLEVRFEKKCNEVCGIVMEECEGVTVMFSWCGEGRNETD